MAISVRRKARTQRVLGVGVVLALAASSLAMPARARTPEAGATGAGATGAGAAALIPGATECPVVMPVSAVRTGQLGDGLTVVKGKTPQPFKVEVLGVLKDGIGAGRDLIMIEVSDAAGSHVIDQGGGIWGGMSGSPVYVDGKLLGAISYGFTAAPSPIGGLTPAADMAKLLTSPPASAPPTGSIKLRSTVRRQLDRSATAAVPRTALAPLVTPLLTSGLNSRRLGQLQRDADRAGKNVLVYGGSAVQAPVARAMTRPEAGGNFAGAITYGDVSIAGVGTTTLVCRSEAVAFGHPFNFAGKTSYGANDATSLAIVRDDSFGSFKMATVDTAIGTLQQDRLSGIAARLGVAPPTTPVTTTIRDLDRSRARSGTTQVTDPSWLATATFYGVFANTDATFDEAGDGRATSTWTITGTRAGGKPFALTRANRWASRVDIAGAPALDAALAVDAIVGNEFEKVKVAKVTYRADMNTAFQQSRITKIAVAVNKGAFATPRSLTVRVGDTLRVKVTMTEFQSSKTTTATISVKVPAKSYGSRGSLQALGGQSGGQASDEEADSSCLLVGDGCAAQPQSLDAVVKAIKTAPRNDDLMIRLGLESETEKTYAATGKATQKSVVTGSRSIPVSVRK